MLSAVAKMAACKGQRSATIASPRALWAAPQSAGFSTFSVSAWHLIGFATARYASLNIRCKINRICGLLGASVAFWWFLPGAAGDVVMEPVESGEKRMVRAGGGARGGGLVGAGMARAGCAGGGSLGFAGTVSSESCG